MLLIEELSRPSFPFNSSRAATKLLKPSTLSPSIWRLNQGQIRFVIILDNILVRHFSMSLEGEDDNTVPFVDCFRILQSRLSLKHRCRRDIEAEHQNALSCFPCVPSLLPPRHAKESKQETEDMGFHSPKASPSKKRTTTTLQYLFDLDSKSRSRSTNSSPRHGKQSTFESEDIEFLAAIYYCNFIFTFTDPMESPSQQDLKRLKLIQILSMIKSAKRPLHDQLLSPVISMLSVNLFRPLPAPAPGSTSIIIDLPDEEELASNFALVWPHLHIVYDILLRLVLNVDPKTLRDYIDQQFVLNLLSLFQSEDPRERESLKNVFHRIYSRFTFYRSFIRKAMNDVFLHYVFEGERHCGIAELLEIWGSIINGFTVPLKEEHKLFLMRVLLPLHKAKGMQLYHRQLSYCVSQFVQKEPALAGVIFRGILKYWPVTNCQKEVLFIGELEELVENIEPDQYRILALPLCTQITRCLCSCNSQVAERALYVWNNKHFVKMASTAMEQVFPVIVEGMESNLKYHWSKSVKQLTESVKLMLEAMDSDLYNWCVEAIILRESAAKQEEARRRERWERIELAAKQKRFLAQPHYICVSN